MMFSLVPKGDGEVVAAIDAHLAVEELVPLIDFLVVAEVEPLVRLHALHMKTETRETIEFESAKRRAAFFAIPRKAITGKKLHGRSP
jgi:hypothetical protein